MWSQESGCLTRSAIPPGLCRRLLQISFLGLEASCLPQGSAFGWCSLLTIRRSRGLLVGLLSCEGDIQKPHFPSVRRPGNTPCAENRTQNVGVGSSPSFPFPPLSSPPQCRGSLQPQLPAFVALGHPAGKGHQDVRLGEAGPACL